MIWIGFFVFLRVGAAMAVLPAFGEQVVPQRIRLCLGLAFTAIVAPLVAADLPGPQTGLPLALVTETVAGLVLGLALRFFIHALQTAGMMIAQATSLSQLFVGAGADPLPAIGNLLTVAGLALAVATGLHLRLIEYFIGSYEVFPPGRLPLPADLARWGVAGVGQSFALAFSLAAPFLIASFIYNLALGVINRAMPQLMVAFVGTPAIALGSMALLIIGAPLALTVWRRALDGFLSAPFVIP
ncbi:MAG: flagellar biosynthesis protein FliR [Cereibacter sphaeroides]|uniref:Flagellar biosynthesis protein FliR n=1 Tax=Cereibacter sphaeroides TaxID=1063 RepID=A0A2W5TQF6_CERSP|nr:MAG: flagellar biosynthesis protein FliR [Cereibacter sphaeroides]